jgi:hypothetical protein
VVVARLLRTSGFNIDIFRPALVLPAYYRPILNGNRQKQIYYCRCFPDLAAAHAFVQPVWRGVLQNLNKILTRDGARRIAVNIA